MGMLRKKSLGIAITGNSLRACVLYGTKKEIVLGPHFNIFLPEGTVVGGEVRNYLELKKALFSIKKQVAFKQVVLSAQAPETDLFREVGAKIIWFESEPESAHRAILSPQDGGTYMMVDIGRERSIISVVSDGEVCYSKQIGINGVLLEDLIRRKWGLEIFYEEINRHYIDWHLGHAKKNKSTFSARDASKKIKKVFIYGDAKDLPTLAGYLTSNLRTEVVVGNVWTNIIKSFDETIPEVTFEESLSYASAVGAALKGLEG